jgi:hypothetical protein
LGPKIMPHLLIGAAPRRAFHSRGARSTPRPRTFREGGGGGLAVRLARKGGRRRHPVSPSASFYAPAVVLSPRGAGP